MITAGMHILAHKYIKGHSFRGLVVVVFLYLVYTVDTIIIYTYITCVFYYNGIALFLRVVHIT